MQLSVGVRIYQRFPLSYLFEHLMGFCADPRNLRVRFALAGLVLCYADSVHPAVLNESSVSDAVDTAQYKDAPTVDALSPSSVPSLNTEGGLAPGDDNRSGSYPGVPQISPSPPYIPSPSTLLSPEPSPSPSLLPSPSPPGACSAVSTDRAAELQLLIPDHTSSDPASSAATPATYIERYTGSISQLFLPPSDTETPSCSQYWRPSSRSRPVPIKIAVQLKSSSSSPVSLANFQQLYSTSPDEHLELYALTLTGNFSEGAFETSFKLEVGFGDTLFNPDTGIVSAGIIGNLAWLCSADSNPVSVKGVFTGSLSADGSSVLGQVYLAEVPPESWAGISAENVVEGSPSSNSSSSGEGAAPWEQSSPAEQEALLKALSQVHSGSVATGSASASTVLQVVMPDGVTQAYPLMLQGPVQGAQLHLSATTFSASLTLTSITTIDWSSLVPPGDDSRSDSDLLSHVSAFDMSLLDLAPSDFVITKAHLSSGPLTPTFSSLWTGDGVKTETMLLCRMGVKGHMQMSPGEAESAYMDLYASVCVSPAVMLDDGSVHDVLSLPSLDLTPEQLKEVKLVLHAELQAQYGSGGFGLLSAASWEARQAACSPTPSANSADPPQMGLTASTLLGGAVEGQLLLTSSWEAAPVKSSCPYVPMEAEGALRVGNKTSSSPFDLLTFQYRSYSAKLTGKLRGAALPAGSASMLLRVEDILQLLGSKEGSKPMGLLGQLSVTLSQPGYGRLNVTLMLGAPAGSTSPNQQGIVGPLYAQISDVCSNTVLPAIGGSYVLRVSYDGAVSGELQWGSGSVLTAMTCNPGANHQCVVGLPNTVAELDGYSSTIVEKNASTPLVVGSVKRVWEVKRNTTDSPYQESIFSQQPGVVGAVKHWLMSKESGLVSAVLALDLLAGGKATVIGSWDTPGSSQPNASFAYDNGTLLASEWAAAAAGNLTTGQLLQSIFSQEASAEVPSWDYIDLSFTVPSGLQVDLKLGCTRHAEQQPGNVLISVGALLPAAAAGPFYSKCNIRQCYMFGAVRSGNVSVAFEYPQLAELTLDPSDPVGEVLLVRFVGKLVQDQQPIYSGVLSPSDPSDPTGETGKVDPCQVCKVCLEHWAGFAAVKLTVENVSALVEDFKDDCVAAKFGDAACSKVAGIIKGSSSGAFGKRAAGELGQGFWAARQVHALLISNARCGVSDDTSSPMLHNVHTKSVSPVSCYSIVSEAGQATPNTVNAWAVSTCYKPVSGMQVSAGSWVCAL